LEVIYNSPQDVFAQFNKIDLPSRESGLRLAYIGLLQVERGLLELLEVLKHHPDWALDLAGFGGDETQILTIARQLPGVTWHGRVSYEKALQLSYSADVLFATYDPAIPNHRFSSPNKVFEAMMLGKPIVVGRHTNMDRIIERADCGLVVTYGDTNDPEAALLRLAGEPELRAQLGSNARQTYETIYSWEQMQTRLLALYAGIGFPQRAIENQ
jgi:glycosyltransferase involved in cell wall biosynthesis